MKLSEDAKRHADGLISKATYEIAVWAEEDQRRIREFRTQSDPKFNLMTQHYEERIRRAFRGLLNAYLEGYRMDEALIDDEDKDEIIGEIRRMINSQHHHVTNSAVASRDFSHPHTGEKIPNMDSYLAGRFERLLGEAAIELNLSRNQLVLEQKQREKAEKLSATNQVLIYGPNTGPIQQGGQNNTQNVIINDEFNAKIQQLLNLIDVARELTPIQKLKASADIRYLEELSNLDPNAEVLDEVRTRLDGITSVISMSADLVSLGMPIIQILRAFFGV